MFKRAFNAPLHLVFENSDFLFIFQTLENSSSDRERAFLLPISSPDNSINASDVSLAFKTVKAYSLLF